MRFQSRLLQDTIERARRKIGIGFSSRRHQAGFSRVFVLAMTAPCAYYVPAVILQAFEYVLDFHATSVRRN